MKEAEFDVAIGFVIRTEQPVETISSIMGTSPSMRFGHSVLDRKNTAERWQYFLMPDGSLTAIWVII